jgi:hypothetical protein
MLDIVAHPKDLWVEDSLMVQRRVDMIERCWEPAQKRLDVILKVAIGTNHQYRCKSIFSTSATRERFVIICMPIMDADTMIVAMFMASLLSNDHRIAEALLIVPFIASAYDIGFDNITLARPIYEGFDEDAPSAAVSEWNAAGMENLGVSHRDWMFHGWTLFFQAK